MKLGSRFRRELVFDIGSSNTVVVSNRKPFLVRVPSRVSRPSEDPKSAAGRQETRGRQKARGQKNGRPQAAPNEPQPEEGLVAPVRHGRVIDEFATEQLLKELLQKTRGRWNSLALRNVGGLLVPPYLEKEERARMRALLVDVGFSRIYLIEAPFAAAGGCGLSLAPAEGQMLMDFGGGKASFAIFSMGELAAWWQESFGSQELDLAIVNYVAQRYKRVISRQAAEKIKLSIGSVFPKQRPEAVEVMAVDRRTEVGKRLVLEDNEIRDVLVDGCEKLILAFQRGFETVAPELAGDVARNGITLLGGGAMLEGLPRFLGERTGLKFRLAPDPCTAAVRGGSDLLRNGGMGSVRV